MADTLNDLYRTDIEHSGDFIKDLDPFRGDIAQISGLENVKAALMRRLITEPGSLIHRPNYGVGIKRFQNAPSTIAVQQQLALRIQEQFEQDGRVESVLGVGVQTDDADPGKVTIAVRVKLTGYGETKISVTPFGD